MVAAATMTGSLSLTLRASVALQRCVYGIVRYASILSGMLSTTVMSPPPFAAFGFILKAGARRGTFCELKVRPELA